MSTFDEQGRHHPHVELLTTGVDLYTELLDTPGAISAGLVIQGNAGGTALEFGLDLDAIAADVTTNNAKATNATHTGDVTGATVLTISANAVDDTHIDFGVGVNQVSAVDLLIVDAGAIITATEVEGALQENRTAINLNTAKATNATHIGEVTGVTALTVDPTAISNKTLKSSLAGTEEILLNDAGTLKKTTAQDIADLGGAGGGIFGLEFEKFESLGQSTNSSGSLIDKIDATTSSKPAGTYRIGFYADVAGSSGSNTFDTEFSIDGVSIHQHDSGPDLYTMEQKNNNDWQSVSKAHYKVLASPSTIDLNIKHAAGTGNSRISNAVIEIWRVS